ncbi:MAG: fused MFS/spermidine synthase [Candidatus Riflebacteria bacterium]|nr:fused MFS/spermidine synthase [Candidatus Riflebacteria bacterium]
MKRDAFLYLTTFICGATIMAVEISSSRYLAPYYGSSMITWTILIGVIMTALSIGNIIGGSIADSESARDRMYSLIWVASIWISIIPFIGKYVITFSCLLLMWVFPDYLQIAGVLFACLTIFSIPCVILGTVTPCLIRLGIKDLEHSGRIAGELYALSTIGSIFGTILPTFLTIPTIGTARTFLVSGSVLCGLSLIYFFQKQFKKKRGMVTFIILLALLIFPKTSSFAFWKDIILEDESSYNYLQVGNDGDTIYLSTHVEIGRQSSLRKNNSFSGSYPDIAIGAAFFKPNFRSNDPLKILVLGFGGGTFAKLCHHFFPNSKIEGVEIDPKIIQLAYKYFDSKPSEARVYNEDGRAFLSRQPPGKYDVIFLDAFQDVTVPFHMATQEFFEIVRDHLALGGCVVVNVNLQAKNNSEMSDTIAKTMQSVFRSIKVCRTQSEMNIVIFASNEIKIEKSFAENIKKLDYQDPLFSELNYVQKSLADFTGKGIVLTDDIAPVELIGYRVMSDLLSENLKALVALLLVSLRKV